MGTDLRDELATLVDTERERFGVPGCAVLVVHDGRVVLREGFGRRDLGRDLPVTTSTLFPIGSSTKTFTAALCALAVDAGLIGWDEPVVGHLPGFALQDPVATHQLTLRDMLAHRSGLPRHDLLWYAASDGSLSRADLIRALRHLQPSRGFRQAWQYNNLVYTTAGELAGRLFGGTYEDAVRQQLLKPLGMARTSFSVRDTQDDADAARPYVGKDDGHVEVPFASLDLVGPAGNVNSTVEDLTGWVLELLGRPQGDTPVLSATALELLRTPVIPLSEVSPMTIGRSVGYGAGLAIDDYRGFRVVHHGGNIDGFSSQVSMIPETGSAVVVLSNRSSSGLRDALPYLVYDRLLDLDPQPHGEHVLAVEQLLLAGMKQGQQARTTRRTDSPPVRGFADYVGRYAHAGYGTLEVLPGDADDQLRVQYRAVRATLHHRHLEVFDLHADLGGEDTHIPVQFLHDLDGEVSAVTAVLDPAVAPIRFERVVDTAHLTDEVLTSLTGTYALGPIELVVSRRGAADLVVRVAGGQPRLVQPKGRWKFAVDALTVEFDPPNTIRSPYGEFTRVDASA